MIREKTVRIKKIGNEWVSTEKNGNKLSIEHNSKTSACRSAIARNPGATEIEMTFYFPEN